MAADNRKGAENMALTIQERIKDLRVEKGLTLEQLAEETGLSRSALGSYESNDTKDISHYAVVKLAKYYGVTTDYLLGLSEMKKHPDAALTDLHLSDEMIEVLKSGRLNTAILSELATHPGFGKLLADVEIYANGMAAMQIQNLNAWMDVVRAKIMEKYQPAENDSTVALLEAAHIDEGEYFSNQIHRDMDEILADIRKAHRGRAESAPDTSVAEKLKADLEEAANFKGSQVEKWLVMFCKQTQINYNKLTEEEKQWLIRIASKSKLLNNGISQRGKKR